MYATPPPRCLIARMLKTKVDVSSAEVPLADCTLHYEVLWLTRAHMRHHDNGHRNTSLNHLLPSSKADACRGTVQHYQLRGGLKPLH